MVLTGLNVSNLIQSVELVRDQAANSATPEGYEITDFSDRVLKFVFSTARLHHSWANLRR
jgi:UDP-N-acetylglucosamine 2-epimerase (non-hydrolysing)